MRRTLGAQARELGWDTLRLFGVGPKTGALRGDFCGILIPLNLDVHKVTAKFIKSAKGRPTGTSR